MAGRTKPATAKPGAALVMGAALAEVLGPLKFQEPMIRAAWWLVIVLGYGACTAAGMALRL